MMKRPSLPFVVTMLVGSLTAYDLPGKSLAHYIDLTYTTMVSAADDADVVSWVERRKGEERLIVASGPKYEQRVVLEIHGDTGDTIRSHTLAPNGRWLVYRRGPMPSPSGRMPNPTSSTEPLVDGLWLVNLSDDQPPQKLTSGGGSASFSPDSDRLAFIKSGTLRVTALDQPALPSPLFVDRGVLSEYAWSPDGTAIAFVSARRTSHFVGLFRFGNDRIRWLAPSTGKDSNIAWSPDGNQIAFLRRPGNNYNKPFQVMKGDPFEVWTVNIDSGQTVRLHHDKQRNLFKQLGFPLRWLSDGRVLFLSEADGYSHLYAAGPEDSNPEQLTSGKFEIESVIVNRAGTTVAIGSNRDDIHRRDIATWQIGQADFKRVSRRGTVATDPIFVGQTGKIAFRSADAKRPPSAAITAADGSSQQSFLSVALVSPVFQEPDAVSFEAADGLTITGQLFRARGNDGQPGSAVVYVHGGPPRQMMPAIHRSLYYAYTYAANQYLASQGKTVLAVNYRCGIGFGKNFHSVPDYGPHGAAEFQDIVAAANYLQTLPTVDDKRIGIYGGSYGGFLTAYALGRRSDLFAAGVAWHGVYDWSFWAKNPQPRNMFFTPWGVAEEDPEVVRQSSPIAHVDSWKSPVLLISGDDDRRVLVEETVVLEQALRNTGVTVETMIIPNEIHSFLRHESWQQALDRTIKFLDEQLE